MIDLLKDVNANAQATVRLGAEVGEWFHTYGTRQGDPASPTIFIAHLERALDNLYNDTIFMLC